MIVYLSPFVALMLLRWGIAPYHRLRDQLYWIIMAAMFLFVAFRFEVGCDWSGYLNHFEIVGSPSYDRSIVRRDPGWWLMIEAIGAVGLPYPFVNVATAIIFFAGVHALARRQPDPFAFLAFLYPVLVVNMSMGALRQAIAIGLVCVAFTAMMDRRVVRFGIWVGLASLFHQSALIFALLLPLVGGRYNWSRLAVAALLAIPGIVFLWSGEAVAIATARYVDTDLVAQGAIFRVMFIVLSGLAFRLFLRSAWKRAWPKDYDFVLIGSLGMMAMVAILPVSTVIADRLAYYLVPVQAVIFARIPYLPTRDSRRVLATVPWVALLALFVVWMATSDHFEQCFVPYQTWIGGYPDVQRFPL